MGKYDLPWDEDIALMDEVDLTAEGINLDLAGSTHISYPTLYKL